MVCPTCHTENTAEAVTCSACGASLRPDSSSSSAVPPSKPGRRSGSRRRTHPEEDGTAGDDQDPSARRAYRLSLWSLLPGVGLFLGPIAVLLGCLAVRKTMGDVGSRNRAKAAILFGVLITLSQWLGVYLMLRGWPP
jgi:hypothetical protein